METTRRTFAKSVTWQIMGILTMTGLSYPHTGSLLSALSLSLTASLTGFCFFFVHEKLWNKVHWGKSG
ncbi:DUF2061 domain-containing protein [Roseibium limicola]|uniref:DUF2061 domain-containing protein n=1 Tax=Roseibium limicola TaxID=2816037 RepID=A0A939EP67_9HYPH|nr:DUF2061 domain-containing protein [Roseibium limicola]